MKNTEIPISIWPDLDVRIDGVRVGVVPVRPEAPIFTSGNIRQEIDAMNSYRRPWGTYRKYHWRAIRSKRRKNRSRKGSKYIWA